MHGSPAPLRDVALPPGDDRSLTPPVPSARSESLPSPYPSTSNSSLSASTTTLRGSSASRTQRTQSSASRRSTPAGSPTNGTAGRRLPTPNANASSTSLSAAVAKSPRVPAPAPAPAPVPPVPRFRAIPHLPNAVNVEPAPPPVMYWSKAPVWGTLPTHGFRAHTVTLADNVAWIFGGCDEKGCFKDMWCFNTGAPPSSDRMADLILISDCRDDAVDASRDAGRPSTTVSRALGDSCRSQGRPNRGGRERLVLQ